MQNLFELFRIQLTWLFGVIIFALLMFSDPQVEHLSPVYDGLLMLMACFAAAVGALGRVWCSFFVAGYKDSRLITVGPYSLCRNPLYFFSFIGAVGVGFATETLTIPAIIACMFAIYYPLVIRGEEKRLAELFGAEYEEYKKTTPSIIPRFGAKIIQPETWIGVPRVFLHHLFDASFFFLFIGFLELFEELHKANVIPVLFRLY